MSKLGQVCDICRQSAVQRECQVCGLSLCLGCDRQLHKDNDHREESSPSLAGLQYASLPCGPSKKNRRLT